jgi:hypothetical protein
MRPSSREIWLALLAILIITLTYLLMLVILAGEGEQGTHNVRHALRLADDFDGILAHRITVVQPIHDELRVVHDAEQGIVNLVRHAAGQRADRFELLLLP